MTSLPPSLTIDGLQKEAETQQVRRAALTELAEDLFETPELIKEIERSYDVPQWGDHHNEGIFMCTHLAQMLKVIDDLVQNGVETVPEQARPFLQMILEDANAIQDLRRYVFVHDISKADLLRVKGEDGLVQTNLEDFRSQVELVSQYTVEGLRSYINKQAIEKISYYHAEKKKRQVLHGRKGVSKIQDRFSAEQLSPLVLKAVEHHEKAHNYENGVNVKATEGAFGQYSKIELAWVVVSSYIDTCASFGKQSTVPDLKGFNNLLASIKLMQRVKACREFFVSEQAQAIVAELNLKPKAIEQAIDTYQKNLSEFDAHQLWNTICDKMKPVLDQNKLLLAMEAANLPSEQQDAISNAITPNGLNMRLVGRYMRDPQFKQVIGQGQVIPQKPQIPNAILNA